MRVHGHQLLEKLCENVLFDCASTVEQHVLAHLLAKVVLRVEALHSFIDNIHDAFHRLR